MDRKSWFVFIVILGLLPIGAFAGEVRVVGDTIVFDAGIGEVNTVTINPKGSVFDGSTGQFITGLTITDSTTSMVVQLPCRKVAGTALCQDVFIARAVIKLGNKNDSVKQDFAFDQGGTPLPMTVEGGLGDDTITGSTVADTLDGGDGNDVIDGGDGDDVITGGLGDDRITGGRGNDTIRGNAGKDQIDGGDGADDIDGGIGDDHIVGGKGKDVLKGDVGDDTIDARDGEVDTINCGIGRDTLLRDSNDSFSRCER